jgi:cytochrome P450
MSFSPVKSGSVNLQYQREEGPALDAHLRWLKHGLLGPYRTAMGIWTLANKYFYPDLSIIEQTPFIQGCFESTAYYCGLNPTFPHITELHLPRSPIYYERFRIPCTRLDMAIPLPQFPVNTFHVQSDPILNQAILKPHRKVEFSGGSDSYLAAFKLLQIIFPETNFTEEDFLLTCGPEFTKIGHTSIIKALDGKKIDQIIQSEGEELVHIWNQYSIIDQKFDVSKHMRRFASAVITQVVFDSREGHALLGEAVSFMNEYLLKSALGIVSKADLDQFEISCATFRTLTNKILESDRTLSLFQEDFTLAQKQGLCLLLFFAGMETTAFALSHNFAKLALDTVQQSILKAAIEQGYSKEINDFVDTQLAEIPPAEGLSRKLTEDAVYSFKTSDVKVQKYVRKGEKILTKLTAESLFGKGANQCIGKVLAIKELRQSIHIILSHFTLSTDEKEFRHVSKVAVQASPFQIKVKKLT